MVDGQSARAVVDDVLIQIRTRPSWFEPRPTTTLSCSRGLACRGVRVSAWPVIAADLVDHRLPAAPYRQWVLTFPWVLRFRLAVDRSFFGALIRGYLHTLFAWQRRRGRAMGIANGVTRSVSSSCRHRRRRKWSVSPSGSRGG
jgi:hypothetical protein